MSSISITKGCQNYHISSVHSKTRTIEVVTIELELSASEVNVSIQWHDSRQPIIAKPRAVGGDFKHARCSDLALVYNVTVHARAVFLLVETNRVLSIWVSRNIWRHLAVRYTAKRWFRTINLWSLRTVGTTFKMISIKGFAILLKELF